MKVALFCGLLASAFGGCLICDFESINVNGTCITVSVPLYRAHNGADHFYTADFEELNHAVTVRHFTEETLTGHIWSQQLFGTLPLFRLFSPTSTDHFYTTDVKEIVNATTNLGYNYEGITGYVYGSQVENTGPLYRLFRSSPPDHLYTMNQDESNYAVRHFQFTYEGVVGYIAP